MLLFCDSYSPWIPLSRKYKEQRRWWQINNLEALPPGGELKFPRVTQSGQQSPLVRNSILGCSKLSS